MRWWACLLVGLVACDPGAFGPKPTVSDAGPNPGASVLPRLDDPLDETPDGGLPRPAKTADAGADASAPRPQVIPVGRLPRDPVVAREISGIVLEASWTHRDVASAPGDAKVAEESLDATRATTEGGWIITLSQEGRMRLDLAARGQPLRSGSVLLGRLEWLGWVLVWPEGLRYRVLPESTARPLLGESRADVSPVANVAVEPGPEGELLQLPTTSLLVKTPVGEVTLVSTTMPELRGAGVSLCRLLVSIAGGLPTGETCPNDAVPLRAAYRWREGEAMTAGASFEVASVTRRTDILTRRLAMPPRDARYNAEGVPTSRRTPFHDAKELASWRTEAGAVPSPLETGVPEDGFIADNRSDRFLYLWVDGVPVTTVDPWSTRTVRGLVPGRYRVQWRTFLGDLVGEITEQDLPAKLLYGQAPPEEAADAG